jgi:integrase
MPKAGKRTAKTEDAYAKRGRQQLKLAHAKYQNTEDAINAFTLLYADPDLVLRPSSTRTYKAAMIHTVKEEVDKGQLDQERALAGIEEISQLLAERRGRPEPRTSRLKCRAITETEFQLISDDLRLRAGQADRLDMAMRLFLKVCVRTGLRPSETPRARLVGSVLLVLNGKHSHGRAPGVVRRISLERMSGSLVQATKCLLTTMKLLVAVYGSVERVCKILAERLARVCKRLGLQRISLYALRHVAIATWKRAGLNPVQIAALAGHISTNTAWRSYAHGRHGWCPNKICVAPGMTTIERVKSYMTSKLGEGLPPPWTPPEDWEWVSSPVVPNM